MWCLVVLGPIVRRSLLILEDLIIVTQELSSTFGCDRATLLNLKQNNTSTKNLCSTCPCLWLWLVTSTLLDLDYGFTKRIILVLKMRVWLRVILYHWKKQERVPLLNFANKFLHVANIQNNCKGFWVHQTQLMNYYQDPGIIVRVHMEAFTKTSILWDWAHTSSREDLGIIKHL